MESEKRLVIKFKDQAKFDYSDYPSQIQKSFAIGKRYDELSHEKKAIHDFYLSKIKKSYAKNNKESFQTTFEKKWLEDYSLRDYPMPSSCQGKYAYNENEREIFKYAGMNSPFKIEGLDQSQLETITKSVDKFIVPGEDVLNSSFAYLFDESLYNLVMNSSIVDRVKSVLGDQVTFLGTCGPMYKEPVKDNGSHLWQNATPWHSATASEFGGGDKEEDSHMITVWVSLNGANLRSGCMKMIPRTFAFNLLITDLLQWKQLDQDSLDNLCDFFVGHKYKFSIDLISQIFARRLNDITEKELFFYSKNKANLNYNPIHTAVELTCLIGEKNFELLNQREIYALEANAGEAYMFTSLNTHCSLHNTSDHWRKAIALRFCKTAEARVNKSDHSTNLLQMYVYHFPKAYEQIKNLGMRFEIFNHASPRLVISGDIPPEQEKFYIDHKKLKEGFAKNATYLEESDHFKKMS